MRCSSPHQFCVTLPLVRLLAAGWPSVTPPSPQSAGGHPTRCTAWKENERLSLCGCKLTNKEMFQKNLFMTNQDRNRDASANDWTPSISAAVMRPGICNPAAVRYGQNKGSCPRAQQATVLHVVDEKPRTGRSLRAPAKENHLNRGMAACLKILRQLCDRFELSLQLT
jgi:hypothetical protein